jgi:hypothetical protein
MYELCLQAPKSVPKSCSDNHNLSVHTRKRTELTPEREGGRHEKKKEEKGGLVGKKSKANNTTNNNQKQKNKKKKKKQVPLPNPPPKTKAKKLHPNLAAAQLLFSNTQHTQKQNKIQVFSDCELQRLLGKNFCGAPV